MSTAIDTRETWDRLALLLIGKPREGWEDIYEEIARREGERLAPHPQHVEKSLAADRSGRGEEDGTDDERNSAYDGSIHN